MARTFLIATRNLHKTREIRGILGARHAYLTLADLPGVPEVVEDADSFSGNALKKARALARWIQARPEGVGGMIDTGSVSIVADDSGLEVDALNGAPGIHSARFAALDRPGHAGNSSDEDNNRKLLRLLEGVPDEKRTGRFRCVIALVSVEGGMSAKTFDGTCEGRIGREQRGECGFGYDPLFTPQGHPQTFAELDESAKNRISHRSRALALLKMYLDGGESA